MPSNADPVVPPAQKPRDNDIAQNMLCTTEEIAAMLKVDPSTIRRWRTAQPPQGPPFVRLTARLTLNNVHDVQRWLAEHRIDPAEVAA